MTKTALQPSRKAAEEHAHIAKARNGPPDPIVASKILLLGFTMAEMKKWQGKWEKRRKQRGRRKWGVLGRWEARESIC